MDSAAIAIARIRPDRPDIVSLLGQLDAYLAGLYPAESNHLLSIDQLLAAHVRFYAALRGGVAIGTGALVLMTDYAEIKRVFVDPQARGAKLGARIVETLIDEALANRQTLLRLETGIHQPEALALFKRAGFRPIGPFGDYRADPLSVFMELQL